MIQKGSKIAIGSDHAGYDMKEAIKDQLQADGYDVIDMGTHDKSVTISAVVLCIGRFNL